MEGAWNLLSAEEAVLLGLEGLSFNFRIIDTFIDFRFSYTLELSIWEVRCIPKIKEVDKEFCRGNVVFMFFFMVRVPVPLHAQMKADRVFISWEWFERTLRTVPYCSTGTSARTLYVYRYGTMPRSLFVRNPRPARETLHFLLRSTGSTKVLYYVESGIDWLSSTRAFMLNILLWVRHF